MEDRDRISALRHRKTHPFLRVVRTFLLIIFVGLAGLIGLVFWQATQAGGANAINQVLPLIIILFCFLFIPGLIWAFNLIHNERIVYYGVAILLLFVVYGGFLSLQMDMDIQKNTEGFYLSVSLAVLLSLFLIFQRFSLWMLGICGVFIAGSFCWQGIPAIIALSQSSGRGPGFGAAFSVCFVVLTVGCVLIAIAYIPRDIEWKRYFLPYRNRPLFYQNDSNKKEGFTLIEMLIAVAMIGIVSAGILHSWSTILRTQKELQIRAHAAEILSSEMNVLMSASELPQPSVEQHSLPIQLSEFVTDYKFEGGYVLEEGDELGIVKVTVLLTQKFDTDKERHFRLVGYRGMKRALSP